MSAVLDAIGLPFEEAIAYFRDKIPQATAHWFDVWKEAHARSFMVAGAATEGLLRDFQEAIQKALSHGTTLAEFRKDFDRIVKTHGWQHTGTPGWRAQIIYETNLSTAYSAGRYAQQSEPAVLKAFPYWEYRHSGSRHPRLMHLAWDGLTLRADDPWWESHYPPNGWHCGCRVAIVSEAGLTRMGKSAPDSSPPVITKPWTNPKTGEMHQVPVGIDPGFDYNMGRAWRQGRAAELPVRAPALRPVGGREPQPSDAQLDALRSFIRKPEGTHDLGELAPKLRAALPGAPERAALPAATVERAKAAGLTPEELLLTPLLTGAPAQAAVVGGQVLAATPAGDALLAGLLETEEGRAILRAVIRMTAAELADMLVSGTMLGGEE